ncbi:MAG: hypothetical protein AAF558_15515 [Verrucomicrobiota bacterium]
MNNRKNLGPVLLGELFGQKITYTNLIPFKQGLLDNTIDKDVWYFVAIGYHSPFHAEGIYTKIVQEVLSLGFKNFTMCLNDPEAFFGFRRQFPQIPCVLLSELFFFYLRYDYGTVFSGCLSRPEKDRDFRAVMSARNADGKNRDLALNVNGLATISETSPQVESEVLPNAVWTNSKFLSREEIASVFARSKTGLILSFIEGANRSTLEYLLSGIPIVSVENKGGRDLLLDQLNSITLQRKKKNREQLRSEVANAVDSLIQSVNGSELSRAQIRRRVLRRLCWLHEQFIESLSLLSQQSKKSVEHEMLGRLIVHAPSYIEIVKVKPLKPFIPDLPNRPVFVPTAFP